MTTQTPTQHLTTYTLTVHDKETKVVEVYLKKEVDKLIEKLMKK